MPHKRDRELHREIESLGYALVRCRKHRIYRHKRGMTLVVPSSMSDHRAYQNALSQAHRLLRTA